jgi:hypothetical protein
MLIASSLRSGKELLPKEFQVRHASLPPGETGKVHLAMPSLRGKAYEPPRKYTKSERINALSTLALMLRDTMKVT